MDYQKAYSILFNAITDAINAFVKAKITATEIDRAVIILKEAQCKTEDMYIREE